MRKLFAVTFLIILGVLNASGQKDPKAADILDKFSEKATSAPSISMKFLIINTDQINSTTDTLSGAIVLSKNSYRLDLPDNVIWFNGETSWSYLIAEQEVTITKPDKNDNSFQSRPSSIFTMYRKDYKSHLIEERPDSYVIDLYPENIKNELIRVRLTIAKPSLNLKSFEYKRRDGLTITLVVKEYNLKFIPAPDMFTFAPEKYKDAEVIDMR